MIKLIVSIFLPFLINVSFIIPTSIPYSIIVLRLVVLMFVLIGISTLSLVVFRFISFLVTSHVVLLISIIEFSTNISTSLFLIFQIFIVNLDLLRRLLNFFLCKILRKILWIMLRISLFSIL